MPSHTTSSEEPIVGGLTESLRHLRQAERALALLDAQRASLPHGTPVPTVWRADALVKRAMQGVTAATAAHMTAASAAYARILHAEQLPTAEAGDRRLEELKAMDEAQLDTLWVKADQIDHFALLGYPREEIPAVAEVVLSHQEETWRHEITEGVTSHRAKHGGDPSVDGLARQLHLIPITFRSRIRRHPSIVDPALGWAEGDAVAATGRRAHPRVKRMRRY